MDTYKNAIIKYYKNGVEYRIKAENLCAYCIRDNNCGISDEYEKWLKIRVRHSLEDYLCPFFTLATEEGGDNKQS